MVDVMGSKELSQHDKAIQEAMLAYDAEIAAWRVHRNMGGTDIVTVEDSARMRQAPLGGPQPITKSFTQLNLPSTTAQFMIRFKAIEAAVNAYNEKING